MVINYGYNQRQDYVVFSKITNKYKKVRSLQTGDCNLESCFSPIEYRGTNKQKIKLTKKISIIKNSYYQPSKKYVY